MERRGVPHVAWARRRPRRYGGGMRSTLLLLLLAACAEDPSTDQRSDAAAPYNLTWSCLNGCGGTRPDLTGTTTLAIDGLTLTYAGGPGGEIHLATEGEDGCLDVEADPAESRHAYQLCPAGTGLDAAFGWWAPSGTSWRAQAWR